MLDVSQLDPERAIHAVEKKIEKNVNFKPFEVAVHATHGLRIKTIFTRQNFRFSTAWIK